MTWNRSVSCLTVLGMLAAPISAETKWTNIGSTSNGIQMFVAVESIKKKRIASRLSYSEIWTRQNFAERTISVKGKKVNYSSADMLFNIRCDDNKYRIETTYGPDRDSNIVFADHNVNFKKWDEIELASTIADVKQMACIK